MTERTEQRGDPEVGVCHVCGQAFDTQSALAQHLMEAHDDDVLASDGAEGAPSPEEQRQAPDGEGGTTAPLPGNPDVGGS